MFPAHRVYHTKYENKNRNFVMFVYFQKKGGNENKKNRKVRVSNSTKKIIRKIRVSNNTKKIIRKIRVSNNTKRLSELMSGS
jgi:hypothetical protein